MFRNRRLSDVFFFPCFSRADLEPTTTAAATAADADVPLTVIVSSSSSSTLSDLPPIADFDQQSQEPGAQQHHQQRPSPGDDRDAADMHATSGAHLSATAAAINGYNMMGGYAYYDPYGYGQPFAPLPPYTGEQTLLFLNIYTRIHTCLVGRARKNYRKIMTITSESDRSPRRRLTFSFSTTKPSPPSVSFCFYFSPRLSSFPVVASGPKLVRGVTSRASKISAKTRNSLTFLCSACRLFIYFRFFFCCLQNNTAGGCCVSTLHPNVAR